MEKNNKIIAEFMGLNKTKMFFNLKTGNYVKKETDDCDIKTVDVYLKNNKPITNFYYYSDWNWLMEVVEKIEECDIVASFQIEQPTIYIWASSESDSFEDIEIDIFDKTKIEAVYEAVVKFINFYNKQKEE